MGAVFSLGQLACCCSSAACTAFSCCSLVNSPMIMYPFMVFLVTITGWIMTVPNVSSWLKEYVPFCWKSNTPPNSGSTNLFDKVINKASDFIDTSKVGLTTSSSNSTSVCDEFTGYLAVYRLMFITTLFFTLFGLIMIGIKKSNDPRVKMHKGFWPIKFMLLIGGIVGAFFIPATSSFADVWKYFGLIGAFLFLFIQFAFVIFFADDWAKSWVSKMNENDDDQINSYCYLVSFVTLFNYVLLFIGVVLMFVYYTGPGCGLHKFFISVDLIAAVILSVVSILPRVQEEKEHSGLLQASVVSLYFTYLTWSALNNSPHNECKPTLWSKNGDTSLDLQSFISLMICFVCILYTAFRLSYKFQKMADVVNLNADDESVSSNTRLTIDDKNNANDEEVQTNLFYFYFVFALATLYLMMTLTNWYSPNESYKHFGESNSSLWIKISTSWMCAGLYLWFLVAPILLPDRDFS